MSAQESAVPISLGSGRSFSDLGDGEAGTLEFDVTPDQEPVSSRPPAAVNGRHAAPVRSTEKHGRRFTVFALIGGSVFVMGLALQALLTGKWHMAADASYFVQGVISIEVSFLLNRWLTWRDRTGPVWSAFVRFNVQKAVTMALNLVAYAGLVWLGVNYLVANVVLAAAFTVINYVAGDALVFTDLRGVHRPSSAPQAQTQTTELAVAAPVAAAPVPALTDWLPTVSVVIPCKASQRTIRPTVESMLAQDYPNLIQVICVGDVGDPTWSALEDITDGRLVLAEHEPQPGRREPNAKRDEGILKSAGDVIALADSDIIMDPGWLSRAVALLDAQNREGLVAGGMRSAHDSFWGAFVDSNQLAAKTPRLSRPYEVTASNFGKRGFKPPITANAVFTRELYDKTPLNVAWSYGYEDYEWFWRVVRDDHKVLFSGALTAAHHHRRSFGALAKEYRLSAEGCAKFVQTYPDCPLARKRRLQAVALPVVLLAVLVGVADAVEHHMWLPIFAALLGSWALLTCREVTRARTPAALAYPFVAMPLGAVYTFALGRGLVTSRPEYTSVGSWEGERGTTHRRENRSRVYWPLAAVMAVQAVLSLSLVWSNTAFADEADYIWQGRLEWAHWLHGGPLPDFTALLDSGLPVIYPPIAEAADAVGGLAGARILSLCFMLTSTLLLYLIGSRLFGRRAGLTAAALYALSEPVLRLAFATYDPLSCFLIIASVWLAIQAGVRKRCGELVALSALVLGLACATTFSFAIYVPAVVIIAFLAWIQLLGRRLAVWCATWLAITSVMVFVGLLTFTHSWPELFATTITRSGSTTSLGYAVSQVVSSAWSWDGLTFAVALAGIVVAFRFERAAHRKLLVVALAFSGLLVVAYQAHLGSSWAMDKHMSAGSGLMALAAGYAVASVRFSWQRATAWCASVALLSYPAITGLWYARSTFHSWPNTTPVVSYLRARESDAPDLVVGAQQGTFWAVQYYLPHLSVTDSPSTRAIADGSYAFVVMSLDGTPGPQGVKSALLRLASGSNPGDYQLGLELEQSHRYQIVKSIPYTSTFDGPGVFVVWKRTS